MKKNVQLVLGTSQSYKDNDVQEMLLVNTFKCLLSCCEYKFKLSLSSLRLDGGRG